MVKMRGQNQRTLAWRTLEPDQDVAETISFRAQTVSATNGFRFRTDRSFVVWNCRMPHEALGDGKEILGFHGNQVRQWSPSRYEVMLSFGAAPGALTPVGAWLAIRQN